MKIFIYGNIFSIIIFFLLPQFFYEMFYKSGMPDLYVNLSLYFTILGALLLLCVNIRKLLKFKGKSKIIPIIFIIPPELVILYFVLGYIAFSRFAIL